MVKFNSKKVFCSTCGDFDLTMFEDEMLGKFCEQPDLKMLRCNRCGVYWSLNYVENYEDEFTKESFRQEIISARIKRFGILKKKREKLESVVLEDKNKTKRKRKVVGTFVERSIKSF